MDDMKAFGKKLLGLVLLTIGFAWWGCTENNASQQPVAKTDKLFTPPDTSTIPHDEFGEMVRYGRELIVNTAYYLGPNGTKGHYLGNKMNCGNCHLDAGTRPYGLNYYSTHARYPQYRGREDRILSLAERVNNCIERPHNGTPMPLDSKEMHAMVCYMRWLSQGVPVGSHVPGDGASELKYLDRPADPVHGEAIFMQHCSSCHGKDGQGQYNLDSTTYVYPPLWGQYGYERGSSMHRILKAARFIKANMPHKLAYWNKPVLTDEEAIDVAAFVNDDRIHTRPDKRNLPSYPNTLKKPVDYDEGPYPDTFTTYQHKFGPYKSIINYHESHNIPVIFLHKN
jgi:thiosulfate dehydrogenase